MNEKRFQRKTPVEGLSVRPPSELGLVGLFLEDLQDCIILTDAKARVRYLNAAANAMIAGGDLLLRSGILWTGSIRYSEVLHGLIARCARRGPNASRSFIAVPRDLERRSLSVLVRPFATSAIVNDPLTMISVVDPDSVALLCPLQLQQQFGLTRAESVVALEIARGAGVQMAAERLNIGCGTVKTHLARIFAKTHTCRQAELARLIFSLKHLAG